MPTNGSHGKLGLVLSGGGITGAMYEIGALAALNDFFRDGMNVNDFNIYVGTSAGSIIGAFVANGVSPSDVFQAIYDNADSPLNFGKKDIYTLSSRERLRLLLPLGKKLAGYLGRAVWRSAPPLSVLLEELQEDLPPGLFSPDNLEDYLCTTLHALSLPHTFAELQRELYIVAVDLDTGARVIFGKEESARVHICRVVVASSAIPLFYHPVRIGDRDLIDGGIGGGQNLDVAFLHGAELVLVINPFVPVENDRQRLCLPLANGKCARLAEKGIGWIGSQTLRIMANAGKRSEQWAVREHWPDRTAFILEPDRREAFMFMHNIMHFGGRRALLDYGYSSAYRFLAQKREEIAESFLRLGVRTSLEGMKDRAYAFP